MKQNIFIKKHFRNIEDLKNYQTHLKNTYKSIGQEITTDLFNPGNIAFSLGKEIFKRIKKRKNQKKDTSLFKNTPSSLNDTKSSKKSSSKRIFKNPWIQWQILFLAIQIIKKIISKVRSQR